MQQWREFKTAAIANSLTLSQPGQNVLQAVVPMLPPILLYILFPAHYRALAYQLRRGEDFRRCEAGRFSTRAAEQLAAAVWAALPQALKGVLEEALIALRALYLCLLFVPAMAATLLVALTGVGRELWLDQLVWTLQQSGPAFIKWGQWASTRPDLFPADVCDRLEQLQTSAPQHSLAASLSAVHAAFGQDVSALFSDFETEPVASGSIAQIHRATLSPAAAAAAGVAPGTVVAVKVRHPGVTGVMHRDFVLMQRAAALCSVLPALRELRLEESIRQFGGPLKEQLDLSVEASHLEQFNANFRSWTNVAFPRPLRPFVAPDVLVESFEEGKLISRYVRSKHRHNEVLAQTGVDIFLKMMLADNFIHADLHPGNILVKEPPVLRYPQLQALLPYLLPSRAAAAAATAAAAADAAPSGSPSTPAGHDAHGPAAAATALPSPRAAAASAAAAPHLTGAAPASCAAGSSQQPHGATWSGWLGRTLLALPAGLLSRLGPVLEFQPKIVLLDTGMIVTLSDEDKSSLLAFFKSLTKMDGEGLGKAILHMAVGQTCKDPVAFQREVVSMFTLMDRERLSRESQTVMKEIIETMRQHQITLRSSVSTVLVSSLVLEGWSSKLDPDVKILDSMRELLAADWADRISLAVDKIMASGSLALS